MRIKHCFWVLVLILVAIQLPAERPKKQILIGALFSITGGWATLGNSSAIAAQIAAT